MFNRRTFLQSSAVALVTTPLLAKDKPFSLVKKVKPFTTGSKELDDYLKSDKTQIMVRVVKTEYAYQFIDHLLKLNDPSTYAVVQGTTFDYTNPPPCKYIFVMDDWYNWSVSKCPAVPHCENMENKSNAQIHIHASFYCYKRDIRIFLVNVGMQKNISYVY